ncbi:GP46-like surface antigen, putative [Bodo saltans]|uniref:non-specific serine/threonine protein kinase n=1 Tax=Bodo saltans TaxID=75058 RepID=A0A0S4JF82_BODSA|nr:GP46-like surface antigen, putative [Bodo saltans]|eukprot:CUG90058.1 GP46-like surface antigen, putative [Bodo saltans]
MSPNSTTTLMWLLYVCIALDAAVQGVQAQGMCGCEHRYNILMTFYNATGGNTSWRNRTGWGNTATTACATTDWFGVTCSGTDVTSIALPLNSLTGSIPESFGNLTSLTALYLNNNTLRGSLSPSWAGNMTNLSIVHLYNNSLGGSLPPQWSSLRQLTSVRLDVNSLSGSLPDSWGNMSSLKELYLRNIGVTGTLPNSWGDMIHLTVLALDNAVSSNRNTLSGRFRPSIVHLYNNSLGGSLPPQWSSLRQLTSVRLDVNSLSGSLPDSWGNMSSLKELYLRNIGVTGTLPNSWGDMIHLTVLALDNAVSSNRNTLSGTLPSSWGNMSSLVVLSLDKCNLNGLLPEAWGNMRNLTTLSLSNNRLSGSLPSSWQNMSRLASLVINNNDLNASLPTEWGHGLTLLTRLYLSSNRLNGSLPDSWSTLSSLSILDLSINSLSGTIPGSWADLTSLIGLLVTSNLCSGQLPDSWGALNLTYLYAQNNSFSGSLPESWGNLSQLDVLGLDANKFDGTLPTSWGKLSSLSLLSLYNCRLTGSLPGSWSGMTSITYMYLFGNLLTGTLPESWSSMSSALFMFLYNNSLTGPLPASWANMSTLQYMFLYSNSLSGTFPAAWGNMSSLGYLDLHSNCLFGIVPNATTFIPLLVSLNLCGTNLTGGRLTTACANNTNAPSSCVAQPYRHTATPQHSDTASFSSISATPQHSDTASLSLTSFYSVTRQTVSMSSSATVSAAPSSSLSITVASVSNESTSSPSASAHSTSPRRRRRRRRYITNNASSSTAASFGASHSPTKQNSMTYERTSSPVAIVIPAPPGVIREDTEVVVEKTGKGLQIVSAFSGGVPSSGSLARMMATKSGDGSDGGLIDFGFLVTCAADQNPSVSAARSGVVSNIVLLVVVHAVLLIAAAGWAVVKSVSFVKALAELCMPSSFMPVWIAVVPTTSDSIVAVMSQLSNSPCLALDATFLACGLAILIVPVAALCMLQRALTCKPADAGETSATKHFTCGARARSRIAWATNRTWLWDSHSGGARDAGRSVLIGSAFVVLREFRVLWYPILDTAILVIISGFSALSGDDTGDQRGWMIAILVLLTAQLVVMIVTRPFTTVMSFAYQTISVALSCLSVAFQLAFMFAQQPSASTTNTRWLLQASSVCDLVIIGISVVKMLEDVISLVSAIARRLAPARFRRDMISALPPSSVNLTSFQLQSDSINGYPMKARDEAMFIGERPVTVELLDLNEEHDPMCDEATRLDAMVDQQLPEFRVDL